MRNQNQTRQRIFAIIGRAKAREVDCGGVPSRPNRNLQSIKERRGAKRQLSLSLSFRVSPLFLSLSFLALFLNLDRWTDELVVLVSLVALAELLRAFGRAREERGQGGGVRGERRKKKEKWR